MGNRQATFSVYPVPRINGPERTVPSGPTDSPPTQDTELITELALTLTSCPKEEKASIIRIFREMLRMIRLIRTGNQNTE